MSYAIETKKRKFDRILEAGFGLGIAGRDQSKEFFVTSGSPFEVTAVRIVFRQRAVGLVCRRAEPDSLRGVFLKAAQVFQCSIEALTGLRAAAELHQRVG